MAEVLLPLAPGRHRLIVRVRTINGFVGPVNELSYHIPDTSLVVKEPKG